MKKISILIPCYNEEENVGPISQAVVETMTRDLPEYDYELVFIDNDSTDQTRPILRELCRQNPRIKAIFNAKNFGQFNSPYYGLLQVTGDCVISMVADFQDPVELIPQYVREWETGGKVGVFFIGQPGLDYPAAVGHVISFHRWLTSFLCVVSSH